MKTYYLYLFFLFFIPFKGVLSATSSISSGNWTKSNTWDNSGPSCGDTIKISFGTIVTVNSQIDFYSSCAIPMFIVVEGTLDFSSGKKLLLPCGSGVLVKQGGQILPGGGGGSSNYIEICGESVWSSGDGPIILPTSYGTPITENIISITSGEWFSATTWDCECTPQFYHNVTIDTSDVVSCSASFDVASVIINGTLDLSASSANTKVYGDWVNNSIFLAGNTSIIFNGLVPQQISGINQFYNLEISNLSGVNISMGITDLTGTLTLTRGTFNTNNVFTLISNASGTARIAEITGGSIVGDVTMQRYIDAGATDWRFFSSAISGTTLQDFNDDFVTSGFTGSDYPNWPSASNPWSSIYFYDETQPGLQDSGFTAATNTTNSLANGEGIWAFCGDTITGTQPFTIDMTGTVNTGNISLPISYTNSGSPTEDGWNMVGNPYPSSIDWDSPNITKSGINNAIYIWNPDLQQFASYVSGIGTNGGSRYIASSQGFWVQATSAGASIQVTEASKSTTDAGFLKTSSVLPLSFSVQNNYGTDEMAINLNDNATLNYDAMFDAGKLSSVNANLPYICSVLNDGTEMSVNQLPSQEVTIPIKVLTGSSGLHTISILNVNDFSNGALNCLFLEDLFTGTIYDLFTQQNITAYISDTTTVARFLLHIGTTNNLTANNISCNNLTDGSIIVENNSSTGFSTTVLDGNGNTVVNSVNNYESDTILNLPAGVYSVEINDATCGSEIQNITISTPPNIIVDYSYNVNGLQVSFTNQSVNGVTYLWDFGDGNISADINPLHDYAIEGTYYVTLTVNQNQDCYETYSQWVTIITTAVNELTTQNDVKMWVKDDNLNIQNPENKYKDYQIKNALGQVLISNSFNGKVFKTVSLKDISTQVLIVSLTNGAESTTFKIVYNSPK